MLLENKRRLGKVGIRQEQGIPRRFGFSLQVTVQDCQFVERFDILQSWLLQKSCLHNDSNYSSYILSRRSQVLVLQEKRILAQSETFQKAPTLFQTLFLPPSQMNLGSVQILKLLLFQSDTKLLQQKSHRQNCIVKAF